MTSSGFLGLPMTSYDCLRTSYVVITILQWFQKESLLSYGFLRLPMIFLTLPVLLLLFYNDFNVKIWRPMTSCGFPRLPMTSYDFLRTSYACLFYNDFNLNIWLPTTSFGFLRLPKTSYDFLMTSYAVINIL